MTPLASEISQNPINLPPIDIPNFPPQPTSTPRQPGPRESAQPEREGSVDLTPNLAEAINRMTNAFSNREITSGKRAKAKEPDTFDGSDSRKLNNFILLCNLYFRNNSAYTDDSAKVTFALSYLRSTALEYFEPTLTESDELPAWMDNWSAFVKTLRTQFGPIDPTGDAESGLDHLKMQDNQHIVKYNVEFNKLAIRTHWDDAVLRHRYYSGLAERIKDVMGQLGKPETLDAMKIMAHSIDSCYWERAKEKSRSGKGKSDEKSDDKKPEKTSKSDDKGKATSSGNSSGNNPNKNKNKSGKPQSSSGSGTSSGTPNPLADKLGKDGKLTPQERQRRFDNNLCMFCGGVGHTAANCNKASSSASKAKARAAQAKESPSGDSKKD